MQAAQKAHEKIIFQQKTDFVFKRSQFFLNTPIVAIVDICSYEDTGWIFRTTTLF